MHLEKVVPLVVGLGVVTDDLVFVTEHLNCSVDLVLRVEVNVSHGLESLRLIH
jgi:hypothetical protein